VGTVLTDIYKLLASVTKLITYPVNMRFLYIKANNYNYYQYY